MAKQPRGFNRRLSPARKFITDLVHFAQQVPTVRVTRTMNVSEVAAARLAMEPPVSWPAIFMKAYALVAQHRPILRQAFMRWPWEHLYEHPISVCAVIVEREYQGEQIVLGTKIRAPENAPLERITRELYRYKTEPVESLGRFRMALLNGRLPRPIRRLRWWLSLHLSGYTRCKRLGTFGLTSVGGLGGELDAIGPTTSVLSAGPIDANGIVNVQVAFDHRVMDAADVARALAEMEQHINFTILDELRALAPAPSTPHRHEAAQRERQRDVVSPVA